MYSRDGPVFVGRDDALTALQACADDAAAGRAWVVSVEGEAGAGKTALVDHLSDALSPRFVVTRAEADELAADVPYGVVGQLAALAATTPFAAGLELVAGWSADAGDRAVAVVVEDLHWADIRSRQALLTAGRRLGRDRVLMVVTSRPDAAADGWERLRLDPRRCRRVEVGALSVDEVAALVAAADVALPRWAVERLHRHTGGHALYVRTLLAELDAGQLARADGDLPAPRTLASTTVAALAGLPVPAQALAMALAVVGRPVPLPVAARVGAVPAPTAALDDLRPTGLVTWRTGDAGATVGFAHPLYRAALYADLSPVRRQALHRAAAEALGGAEALAHRAAAADGPDPALADDLAAAAGAEPVRGVAARHLLDAHAVAAEPGCAERYLLEGVWQLLGDGQLVRAAALRGRVEGCAPTPLRDLVLGALDHDAGRGDAAEPALRRAVDAGDPAVVAGALGELGTLYVAQGRGAEALHAGERLLALPDTSPEVERDAWVVTALGEMFVGGAAAGLDRLAHRLPQPPDRVPVADGDLLITRGTLCFYAGRATAAIADLRAGVRLSRRVGSEHALPRAHLQLAHLLAATGDWAEGFLHARLALSLVDDEQLVWMQAQVHAVLGRLHACQGDWDDAEAHVTAAVDAAAVLRTPEAVFTACIAGGTLARARGDPAGVLTALRPMLDPNRAMPMASSLTWWPAAVLAMLDDGDVVSARSHVERLRRAAHERRIDLGAQLTGLAALIAEAEGHPDAAADGLARATDPAGPDVPVLDRADLHRRYGLLLVHRGRRREGVAQLRRAAALLTGAEPFLRRVEADLAAVGKPGSRRAPRSPLDLTERERDVVALVVRGMTNREAAAELYVSDKAVEYHLGNVYAKLGIRSRRELRRRLGS